MGADKGNLQVIDDVAVILENCPIPPITIVRNLLLIVYSTLQYSAIVIVLDYMIVSVSNNTTMHYELL